MVFAGLINADVLKADGTNSRLWQELLPELVMMLIKASAPGAQSTFPAGNSVFIRGLDGEVSSSVPYKQFLPIGDSSWEIGTSANAYTKAVDDMRKRALEIQPTLKTLLPAKSGITKITSATQTKIDRAIAQKRTSKTLVLVVTGGEALNKASFDNHVKVIGGLWLNVVVLKATEIYNWLIDFPAVHTWVSYKLGNFNGGARPISAIIQNWENRTIPRLPTALLEASSEWPFFSMNMQAALLSNEKLINISKSKEDTLVKVCHLLSSIEGLESRAIVVDTPDAWLNLVESGRSELILIPSFEGPTILSQSTAGPTIISLVDTMESFQGLQESDFLNKKRVSSLIQCPDFKFLSDYDNSIDIREEKSRYNKSITAKIYDLDKALLGRQLSKREKEEFDAKRTQLYGKILELSGSEIDSLSRNFTLFRKRAMIESPPIWSPNVGDPPGVTALLLVSSWDASNSKDREALEHLTGVGFTRLEAWLNSSGIENFFIREDDTYTIDPYTLDDTNFPFKVSQQALKKWQNLTLALIKGKKKTQDLSPQLKMGVLSTMVKLVMLKEQKIIKTATDFITPIKEKLFVDSSSHAKPSIIWSNPENRGLLCLIWEAFPLETLEKLALEDFDSMYWEEGFAALKSISRSAEHSSFLADIVLNSRFFEHYKADAVELVSQLFNPWYPLLNITSAKEDHPAWERFQRLQRLRQDSPDFLFEVLRKVLGNNRHYSWNKETGVRHWDHRWVNETIYTNSLFPFWQLALDLNFLTARELMNYLHVPLTGSVVGAYCSCNISTPQGCPPSKTGLVLIAETIKKGTHSSSWSIDDHFNLEALMEKVVELRNHQSKFICEKAWQDLNYSVSHSRNAFKNNLATLDAAPSLGARTVFSWLLCKGAPSKDPLECLDFLAELPTKRMERVNLHTAGSAAARISNGKKMPSEKQFESWPEGVQQGFVSGLDVKDPSVLKGPYVDFSQILLLESFTLAPLTMNNHRWIASNWSPLVITQFYPMLREVEPKSASLLIPIIAEVLEAKDLETIFSLTKNAFRKTPKRQQGKLIKALIGVIQTQATNWDPAWVENEHLITLLKEANKGDNKESNWAAEIGKVVFIAGGRMTPALALRFAQSPALAIISLRNRSAVSSIHYIDHLHYGSTGLIKKLIQSPLELVSWSRGLLSLSSTEPTVLKNQIRRFVTSVLAICLTSSPDHSGQASVLDFMGEVDLDEFFFGEISLWTELAYTRQRIAPNRWGETPPPRYPEAAKRLKELIKSELGMDLILKVKLARTARLLDGEAD